MATKRKIAISIQDQLLRRVDSLVSKRMFRSRSGAIQEAIREKLERIDHGRLARECAKLDPEYEQALAEQGMSHELEEWPEY